MLRRQLAVHLHRRPAHGDFRPDPDARQANPGHQRQSRRAISYRGGFPNTYHLTVKDCVIEDSGDDGIYAEDRLSVINTRIFNSTGHGININSDDLDVSNGWIAGNSEHGISAGDTVLTNCTLSGNGENGIRNGDGNQLLTNCTVTGNKKGVEVSFEDIGLYTNCTIMGNIEEDARSLGTAAAT